MGLPEHGFKTAPCVFDTGISGNGYDDVVVGDNIIIVHNAEAIVEIALVCFKSSMIFL